MTIVQGHDRLLGHKQFLSEVRTPKVSPSKRYVPDMNLTPTKHRGMYHDIWMHKIILIYPPYQKKNSVCNAYIKFR